MTELENIEVRHLRSLIAWMETRNEIAMSAVHNAVDAHAMTKAVGRVIELRSIIDDVEGLVSEIEEFIKKTTNREDTNVR